jgi:hypothetical protein
VRGVQVVGLQCRVRGTHTWLHAEMHRRPAPLCVAHQLELQPSPPPVCAHTTLHKTHSRRGRGLPLPPCGLSAGACGGANS